MFLIITIIIYSIIDIFKKRNRYLSLGLYIVKKQFYDSNTSGLFCAKIPTNCCGLGWQPLANRPEPRPWAHSATWGSKCTRDNGRGKIRQKKKIKG